jgi:hypothetical protein
MGDKRLMSLRQQLSAIMPTILKHEGVWQGVYRHLDADGQLIDQHHAHVTCEFPAAGEHAYVQRNHFIWDDGREHRAVLPGVIQGRKLYWDVETFSGFSWESEDGIVLLNLTRKDDPGTHFFEMITLGAGCETRARTWHWFNDGRLFKRTLCDEVKVS